MRCYVKDALQHGPGKLVRLCLFGFLLPVSLLSLLLYVRLILYPPQLYSMAPTDQRLLNQKSSSFWCKAQIVRMNGSFNAYLLEQSPTRSKYFSTHTMKKHLTLKNDVKEYWGFFLEKGSVVTFNLCSRYEGSALMIMKGVGNLQKCAWLGRNDISQQDEDDDDNINESEEQPEVSYETYDDDDSNEMEIRHMSSSERKRNFDHYVRKLLRLGKNKKEIMQLFNKNDTHSSINNYNDSESIKFYESNGFSKLSTRQDINETKIRRLKRALEEHIDEGAFEILDDSELYDFVNHFPENSSMAVNHERNEYLKLFRMPKGLIYERAKVNQTNNQDALNEAYTSSASNSEESLANCSGVQGLVPLLQNRQCYRYNDTHFNRITYKTPSTGTYYFVFSNDNDIIDAKLYINMTLQKVVFDTQNATNACHNETSCSLAFSFGSNNQAIVEVPEGDWDSAYTLEVTCKPRVTVYLFILLFIPVILLFCALQ